MSADQPPRGVCVVGSSNLDLVATVARHPRPGETVLGGSYAEHPGGKGLNQAVACSRSGAPTSFVSAVGSDQAGAMLANVLADETIDSSGVAELQAPTGRALIIVDDTGENSIVVVPGANALVRPPAQLPHVAVLLTQLEIPLDAVVGALRAARTAGITTVLNPAPAQALPAELVSLCDIIIPNEHELEILGGPDALLHAGAITVVNTRGSAGVDIITEDATEHISAFSVEVVDTTGAGDAFCGSLAARLASGDGLWQAARWAAAAGALATTVAGAVPAQPHAAAIRSLLDA